MLAAAVPRQHRTMTVLKPSRPSERCGRITAAKTGGSRSRKG